jgi:hypothetical protein
MCQSELPLTRPKVTPEMVAQMEQVLADSAEPWVFAAMISYRLQLGIGEAGKRIVRELASRSQGKIISGQLGYCHISRATESEVRHSAAALFSQACKIRIRAEQQLNAKGLQCS